MAPKKIGAAKKPRVSSHAGGRRSAAESDKGAKIMEEMREMIKDAQELEPDITAGWIAKLGSTASAFSGSATLSDWLGADAATSQVSLALAIVDMGQRAFDGRGALWRNCV